MGSRTELVMAYTIMITLQVAIAVMHILTEVAFSRGLSFFIFVTYRHAVATLAIAPFAYVLERNKRPPLTLMTFCHIFLLALVGITITLNLYFAGLKYTSPTFVSALINAVPVITLAIAIVLKLEKLNLKRIAGQIKLAGTIVCIGGAMLMAFYKGPAIKKLTASHIRMGNSEEKEDWTKGSILAICSCFGWGVWYVMQATVVVRYPAQLSMAAFVCFLSTVQSAVATAFFEHNSSVWTLKWDVKLLTIIYSGVVCSAIAFFLQFWCSYKRGPVFVAMFTPLLMVTVAVLATIILGERLYLGTVVGAVLVVSGLYSVLWGKYKEAEGKPDIGRSLSLTPASNDVHPTDNSDNDEVTIVSRELSISSCPETIAQTGH